MQGKEKDTKENIHTRKIEKSNESEDFNNCDGCPNEKLNRMHSQLERLRIHIEW